MRNITVRIVARGAANAAVIGILIAFAIGQPVRLKADVGIAAAFWQLHDCFPTAMARTAHQLIHVVRRPASRIENFLFGQFLLPGFERRQMVFARPMADFAL